MHLQFGDRVQWVNRKNSLDGEPVFVCLTEGHYKLPRPGLSRRKLKAEAEMKAQLNTQPRFVRRTQLGADEYRKNFQQIDREIIEAITSEEADRVTPLMSKMYLRLINAPARYWEREGVLRFEAELREEGKSLKAWAALCELLGVASATASKALAWLHETGVIGYFAGKNGVGIRIFLNRAASSIGSRQAQGGKKILEFAPASGNSRRASPNEAAFNDSFAVQEISDPDFNSRAPKSGADKNQVDKTSPEPAKAVEHQEAVTVQVRESESAQDSHVIPVGEIVRQVVTELESSVHAAARAAAAREHERTREWLESKGLPKAARVAQREAYNVLRSHGLISASAGRSGNSAEVGRSHRVEVEAKPLNPDEIRMYAEVCVALLETQGQTVDVTLAEMSSEAGGAVLPEDAPKIREAANLMINSISKEG